LLFVTTLSRFTMASEEPAKSRGIVVPSAVDGSVARFAPTVPSKCTSPPKPIVTVRPLPFQSGFSGECSGKCSAVTVACWAGGDAGGVLPEPPEKNAK